MSRVLKANIWKYFIILLTERRNYIPILALYFLSLPDTNAQQIGLYIGIGTFAGFLLEIPSGYLSDTIGHKFSLIIAKISLLLSTCFFVFGSSLIYFIIGSAFISIGFAFASGTNSAFLHNTLTNLRREEEFGVLSGKIRGYVSLVSAFMILAKFSLLFSTCFFVFGSSLIHFIFGSIFISVGFAFSSGTSSAFFHNTLTNLNREGEFGVLSGKIRGYVSLVSAFMILALPFLSSFSLLMPIKVYLIFDVLGLFVAFFLHSPKMVYSADDVKGESILSQLKRFRKTGFYLTSIFLGVISGFMFGLSGYKEPFVASLGMPVVLIGFIMASSRFFWFIFSHNLSLLKKLKMKQLLFIEMFLFSGIIVLSSLLKHPYLIGLFIALLKGYFYARKSIIEEFMLSKFSLNKRYKATLLSVMSQISMFFQSVVSFFVGFVMVLSFSLGFFVAGIALFFILFSLYPFVMRSI